MQAVSPEAHFDYKMFVIIDRVTYLGISVHILLTGLFYYLGYMNLSLLNIACTVAWVHGRNLNQQGRQPLAILFLSAEVILHTIAAVSTLGWESGFQFYLIGALIFNIFSGRIKFKEIVALISIFLGVFIGLKVYTSTQVYEHEVSWLMNLMYYNNVVIAVIAMSLVSYYFKEASKDSETKIRHIANTDHLTGLLTRRSMSEHVDEKLRRCISNKQNSAVIMADIDFFKKINDTYGHASGDEVLKEVANRLKENLRHHDSVFRWGGEEFMLILPNISMDNAKEVCEGLRADISAAVFMFEQETQQREFHISMTFGIAAYNEENDCIEEAISKADKALYSGKKAGRNRVVVANENEDFEHVEHDHRKIFISSSNLLKA